MTSKVHDFGPIKGLNTVNDLLILTQILYLNIFLDVCWYYTLYFILNKQFMSSRVLILVICIIPI